MAHRTRSFVIRSLFLALCILPTMFLFGWAVSGDTPKGRTETLIQWRQSLSHELNVDVHIGSIESFETTIVLNDVGLFDKEHGKLLAKSAQVTIYPAQDLQQVVVSQLEVYTAQLDLLGQAMNHIQQSTLRHPIVIDAAQCNLVGPDARTLTDLRLQVRQTDEQARWDLAFRVAGAEAPSKSHFRLRRDRRSERPLVAWELETSHAPLPVSVAWSLMPKLRMLGAECEFQGRVVSEQFPLDHKQFADGGRATRIQGTFRQLDIQGILENFFYRLTSSDAELLLQDARIENDRLTFASGSFKSSAGTIGRRFMQQVSQSLFLKFDRRFEQKAYARYSRLGLAFQISKGQLALAGLGPRDQSAMSPAVMVWGGGTPLPMIAGQARGLVPAVAISNLLSHRSAKQVAATKEAYNFLKHLPVPKVERPPNWQSIKPRTSVRVETP